MQLGLADQIGLADEDLVGKTDLALCFQALVQLRLRVLGIDQRDDGVEQVVLGNLVVHEEGLRHRAGIGQAGGLDHDTVEIEQALALLGRQQRQRVAQIVADGAADAAVAHLDDLLVGIGDQDVVVDVFLAKLVLDDGDLLAVRLGQDALEQGGLAGAEEAGEDGGGNHGHGNLQEWRQRAQRAGVDRASAVIRLACRDITVFPMRKASSRRHGLPGIRGVRAYPCLTWVFS